MKKSIFLIILFSLPTFVAMLRFGVYTTHDFHFFRQYEFNRCTRDNIFPCRWSADSGKGYGQPVFNFYGQFPYWIGQIFILSGLPVIDSVKAVFILSLLLSGISMFIFSRTYWGNLGGLISAVFYMYAPYRALDVWVRGALPEALSFVFFPLLFFCLDRFLHLRQVKYILFFSLIFSLLIVNHNLSAYMITPFLGFYYIFLVFRTRFYQSIWYLLGAGLFSLAIAAFYLLPVILENSLTTVTATTQSYYNFALHYTTIRQLFFSLFWGYGGSVWGPNDTLSFSVGQLHWLMPLLAAILIILRKLRSNNLLLFFAFASFGVFALFLTHGKSEFIWKTLPGMPFVQFPWRFLSPAVFFLSLSLGILPWLFGRCRNIFSALIITGLIAVNLGYYRPDIWRPIGDSLQFSGDLWDEQRSSALQDYWPRTAPEFPDGFAPDFPQFLTGWGNLTTGQKKSQSAQFRIRVDSSISEVSFPIVYFPGWYADSNNQRLAIYPKGDLGLITALLPQGDHQISLVFRDTPVRALGNLISLVSLGLLVLGLRYAYKT